MAAGSACVTMPFVAAAIGIYLCDRNINSKQNTTFKEMGSGVGEALKNIAAKAKVELKASQMPKLAPQFDGLDCFETIVGRL